MVGRVDTDCLSNGATRAGCKQSTIELCLQQLVRLRVSQSRECLRQLFTLWATAGGYDSRLQSFTAADLLALFRTSSIERRSQFRSQMCVIASADSSTLALDLCRVSLEWCTAHLRRHLQAVVDLYRNDVLKRNYTEIFESQVCQPALCLTCALVCCANSLPSSFSSSLADTTTMTSTRPWLRLRTVCTKWTCPRPSSCA